MTNCCVACINLAALFGVGMAAVFTLGSLGIIAGGIYEISCKNYSRGCGFVLWIVGTWWFCWPVYDRIFSISNGLFGHQVLP